MNISVVKYQFPIFKFDQHGKWLYNPVLKKRFKNRPEERVRLQWVEFLLNQTEKKSSRIGFETPVKLRQEEHAVRADLILYNSKLEPEVLIECKAEQVSLMSGSAEQAARYNSEVGAEYIILSNGVKDLYYSKKGEMLGLDELPIVVHKNFDGEMERSGQYWADRGFCGPEPVHVELLNRFWTRHEESEIRYLNFKESVLPIPMEHYYRLYRIEDSGKLAVGFLGGIGRESYMVAVLNERGVNEAVAVLELNQFQEQKKGSVTIYKKEGVTRGDGTNGIRDLLDNFLQTNHQELTVEIMKFF